MAVAAAPSVGRAKAGAEAAAARTAQIRAGRKPALEVEGDYNRIGPVPELSFPGFGTFALYPVDNIDAHLAASYTLYDFGRAAAEENAALSRAHDAAYGIDAARAAAAFQTVQAFHQVRFLRQCVSVQDTEIVTLEAHLDVNRKKLAAGAATDFDLLSTRARIAASRTRRIDLAAELARQEIALRRLLGAPDDAPLPLTGSFSAAPVELPLDTLIARALRRRIDLLAARGEERTASLGARAASLGAMPTLNLHASWGLKNGYIPNLDAIHGNWVAGAGIRVPLYEGGRTDARVQEAEALLRASEAHSEEVLRDVRAGVQRAFSDAAAARERIANAGTAVAQAREALAIAQKRYAAGSGSNIDVLDAENALAQADLILLRAQFTCLLDLSALDHATGERIWER